MIERRVPSFVDPRREFFSVPKAQYGLAARNDLNFLSVFNCVTSSQGEPVPAGPKGENERQFLEALDIAGDVIVELYSYA
jgi:hypothetical protein